ncbi:hypothetical protein AVEN_207258-1 [Araneus ventricosus]|uniref:Uncharacterized protein n=1 Tax=Araneus ventricosus TaxID=182803 RepID=A0A4Y2UJ65_ARAVE|nr:hypothetical protein AVEN_207258-1 [Araneus ventricosus]
MDGMNLCSKHYFLVAKGLCTEFMTHKHWWTLHLRLDHSFMGELLDIIDEYFTTTTQLIVTIPTDLYCRYAIYQAIADNLEEESLENELVVLYLYWEPEISRTLLYKKRYKKEAQDFQTASASVS